MVPWLVCNSTAGLKTTADSSLSLHSSPRACISSPLSSKHCWHKQTIRSKPTRFIRRSCSSSSREQTSVDSFLRSASSSALLTLIHTTDHRVAQAFRLGARHEVARSRAHRSSHLGGRHLLRRGSSQQDEGPGTARAIISRLVGPAARWRNEREVAAKGELSARFGASWVPPSESMLTLHWPCSTTSSTRISYLQVSPPARLKHGKRSTSFASALSLSRSSLEPWASLPAAHLSGSAHSHHV